MIAIRIEGDLKLREQLRAIAQTASERRAMLRKIGSAIARKLRTAIRRQVRAAPPGTFADAGEKTRRAREFARLVKVRATSDQVMIFDRGLLNERPRQGDQATAKQADRLRALGFQLPRRYIIRHFSQGLAGMIIRELENGKRGRRRERKRGSLVLLAWRRNHEKILAEVNIAGIVRNHLAA